VILAGHGFRTDPLISDHLPAFRKAGGGPACCTLELRS